MRTCVQVRVVMTRARNWDKAGSLGRGDGMGVRIRSGVIRSYPPAIDLPSSLLPGSDTWTDPDSKLLRIRLRLGMVIGEFPSLGNIHFECFM